LEFPNKSVNLREQTLNIMKKLVKNIIGSVELEVLIKMSKPKVILSAIALNILGFFFMYGILDLLLFIQYSF